MGATSNYSWPLPENTDSPNVPRDFKKLGDAADATTKTVDNRVGTVEGRATAVEGRATNLENQSGALNTRVGALETKSRSVECYSGRNTVTFPGGSAYSNTSSVTFPAGIFTAWPRTVAIPFSASLYTTIIGSLTQYGFSYQLRRIDGTAQSASSLSIDWISLRRTDVNFKSRMTGPKAPPAEGEPATTDKTLTCETAGCPNSGVHITMPVFTDASEFECGVCGEPITNIT